MDIYPSLIERGSRGMRAFTVGHMTAGKGLIFGVAKCFEATLKTTLYSQLEVYDETDAIKLLKLLLPVSHVHLELPLSVVIARGTGRH